MMKSGSNGAPGPPAPSALNGAATYAGAVERHSEAESTSERTLHSQLTPVRVIRQRERVASHLEETLLLLLAENMPLCGLPTRTTGMYAENWPGLKVSRQDHRHDVARPLDA